MVKVVIVSKDCVKKCSEIKNFDMDKLYKKCNLRKNDYFKKRHTWKLNETNSHYISIYAKNSGRATNENKYDLPPPLDKELYYGSLLLIKHTEENLINQNVKNLLLNEWEQFYESLFGGFENLNDEDSYSEEEEIPEHMKTLTGYSKEGGFVVEDENDSDSSYDGDYVPSDLDDITDESDDFEEKEAESDNKDNSNNENDANDDDSSEDEENLNSDLGSELSEESYINSDSE